MGQKRIGGRWKGELLGLLKGGPCRWAELLEALPEAGPGSLGRALKELQADGLILRQHDGTRYQKVRYRLTEQGLWAAELLARLEQWQISYGMPDSTAKKLLSCPAQQLLLETIRVPIRPGALEKACPQLSRSVMERHLVSMARLGLLHRKSYPSVPPRVEYGRTAAGEALATLLAEA